MSKSYLELCELDTFEERVEYLMLKGIVCEETFGFDRYLNQALYNSKEWKELRNKVIIRDLGCDLGVDGYYIRSKPIIHHINPITRQDVINRSPCLFDMNNLITTTKRTHDAIHYSDSRIIANTPAIRKPGDTCPWM